MAVFTFSTKGSNAEATATIERIKDYCLKHNLNFSAVVVEQLAKWERENVSRNKN